MSDESAEVVPNLFAVTSTAEGREKLAQVGSVYLRCRIRDHDVEVLPLTLVEELNGGYISFDWIVDEAELRGSRRPLSSFFDEKLVILVKELQRLGKTAISDARVGVNKVGATVTFEFLLVVPTLMPGERVYAKDPACSSSSSS